MLNITIDSKQIQVAEGTTILQAAREAGIAIPTLCYLEGVNDIGACRLCIVEVEGQSRLVPSCNTKAEDGMVIRTNTEKVRTARRLNTEMILSQHHCQCTTCVRSGNCVLQKIANDLGIMDISYPKKIKNITWNQDYPLIRDESRCVKCMRCIQICNKVQGMHAWDVVNTGGRTTVGLADGKTIDTTSCALCGQCITHCPVGALRERDDTDKVLDAIADPDKITVVQVAPAVRSAWGEDLGLSDDEATEKRMAAALRKLGFDYVFDTNFSADLTIMEEGSELVHMLEHPDWHDWPLFTSCCPGWVRFLKTQYQDMVEHLSTAKSPQQMFGAVAKTYYAKMLGVDANKIYCVSIMPCLAKKYECAVEDLKDAGAGPDVDVVLTTREFARLIKRSAIDAAMLPEEEFDSPLGTGTGAAVIFGATGGVMEAALRYAAEVILGKKLETVDFPEVRGVDGVKFAAYKLGDLEIKVAVASGTKNAKELLDKVKSGEVDVQFIEIMACPGGCVNGGGQPYQPASVRNSIDLRAVRAAVLYNADSAMDLRKSQDSSDVMKIYKEFLGAPNSHKAHEVLHTSYIKRGL